MTRRLPTLVACFLLACGGPAREPVSEVGGPPVCQEGPPRPTAELERGVAVLGPSSNAIRAFGAETWIVESGANTVSRLRSDGTFDSAHVDVGEGRNPYDVFATRDRVFVTNYLADSVTVADRATGEVIAEKASAFDRPAGIAATADRLYVTNVAFDEGSWNESFVTVLDLDTLEVFGTVSTAAKNAQFVDVFDIDGTPRVLVVDTGPIEFTDTGAVARDGAVEIWTETDDPLRPDVDVARLPVSESRLRVGAPGRPVHLPGTSRVYLSSGTAPVLFELDAATSTWIAGTDAPHRFSDVDDDALTHAAIGPDGIAYVTSFNEDALYLFDTACNQVLAGPLSLDDTGRLAGPHGAIARRGSGGVDVTFILSLANELGRVKLDFDRSEGASK